MGKIWNDVKEAAAGEEQRLIGKRPAWMKYLAVFMLGVVAVAVARCIFTHG